MLPLLLIVAATSVDGGIQINIIGYRTAGLETTAPIILNEEIEDFIKIVRSLKHSGKLLKKVLLKQVKTK